MSFIAYLFLAYLFGSIPWGFIVAKLNGVNLQKKGSGNIGATNVYRALGLSYALIVFLLDVFKGVFVMLVAKFSVNSHYEIAALALAVILGHTFSVFLKGKGGKGVATTFGVLLILIGWKVMVLVLLMAIGLLILTRYMSLTNLTLIWIFPAYFVFVDPDFAYFLLGIIVTLLVYWEHRTNIERLKAGTELRLQVNVRLKSERKSVPKIANAAVPVKANKKPIKKTVKKASKKTLLKNTKKAPLKKRI